MQGFLLVLPAMSQNALIRAWRVFAGIAAGAAM